ncbi:unnamed protein product, partial [Adineta steineri]
MFWSLSVSHSSHTYTRTQTKVTQWNHKLLHFECKFSDISRLADGWKSVGHTIDEQNLLHDMSIVVAAWPEYAEDNIPTVPCLSADGHLLVLSVGASRIRYG